MLRILDPFAIQYTSTVPDMIDTIIAALSCDLIESVTMNIITLKMLCGQLSLFLMNMFLQSQFMSVLDSTFSICIMFMLSYAMEDVI